MEVALCGLELVCRDVTASHESFGVEGSNAALCLNQVVHQRLGHRGVVAFVVPAATVADDVDDHIALEGLAVGKSEFSDTEHGFGVIAVDVENRRLDGLRHIGGVDRGSRIVREGREADLVVHNDVNRSTGPVRTKLRHLQCFEHHTLTGHSSIAVDQDGKNSEAANGAAVLLGANDALQHAVHSLEV